MVVGLPSIENQATLFGQERCVALGGTGRRAPAQRPGGVAGSALVARCESHPFRNTIKIH